MTSRFGKTYNRKGGEANSKFDEVFNNKKPTLTTKWGETTYKAQLGGKRPILKPEVSELSKRPRLEDSDSDSDGDPFGFDSDDESKTVTSHVSQSKVNEGAVTKSTAVQGGGTATAVTSAQGSASSTATFTTKQTSEERVVKNNQTWYKSTSDSNQKPACKAPLSDTVSSNDQNLSAPKRPISSPNIFTSLKLFTDAPGGSRDFQTSSCYDELPLEEMKGAELEPASEPPPEPVDNIPPSPFTLRASNCKKYQRPTRQSKASSEPVENNSNKPTEAASAQDKPNSVLSASASSTAANAKTAAKPVGRGGGRVRDYTVLHPSCLSVCNVTIQDSIERGIDELVTPAVPADLGDAGQMKKKSDAPPPKPTSLAINNLVYPTDAFDFSDDSSPGFAEGQKGRSGKPGDKSKDIGSGLKKIFSGPKKSPAKAVYNARHWNQPEPEEIPLPPLSRSQTAPAVLSCSSKDSNSHKDDGLFKAPPPPPKVIKSETLPTRLNQDIVTALKCRKEHKELYTVVQHVKHFNDVVEFGENQEFTDDFEYLETGLKSSQPLNTRCLSIISLATRCAMPGFRMHLRARGKVAQVFKMLSDAPQHPNLGLCTASLMYILSRDRLNMDLDRACLELMIKLLELDQDYSAHQDQLTAKEVEKVKEKIRKLCETVHNKHLDLENITTGHLAMETLLSLTSKRAGDWFKEELRLLGGLDHIVDKVKECVQNLSQEDDKENLVASLWGAERCLRVLESVTVQNPENQGYLIAYKDSQLIVSSARALRYCEDMIQRYSRALNNSSLSLSGAALPHCSFSNVGKAVEDCMRAIIGVLLNLTHDNEWGSTKTGEQEQLTVTALNCVLRVPRYIPHEQRFDVRVLGLGLLINLVEYSSRNRHCLVDMEYTVDDTCLEDSLMQPADQTQSDTAAASAPPSTAETQGDGAVRPKASGALAALVQLFLERERAAILAEAKTDDLISEAPKPALDQSGEWQETSGEIQWVAAETNDSQTEKKEEEKKEEEDEELDLNKALQHAGKHMEDSIVASYTALLLGCLCQGSQTNATTVREHLPKGDFSIMTEMLKKFLSFMNLTCAMGTTGQKSISRVIDYLEHC
ncbi:wings apart-like protein homolog [Perca fluviatilis]|uniref:wings apart-like protein homolog n=1 Tax=Perca fluviatilis TaxID=8168 RepID=UPI001966A5ED|nr:wings apart-like protein homolog [Perca fluviatilis]